MNYTEIYEKYHITKTHVSVVRKTDFGDKLDFSSVFNWSSKALVQ